MTDGITFDSAKGEVDIASGHRRWVREALEKRLKKATATGTVDLSGPLASSLVSGHASLQLDLVPKELFATASKLSWAKTHLRRLYLTNNSLSLLSPEVALFQQLRVLGLGGNALTSLPTEIGSLPHLEALYAERNQLTCVPESLGRCKKLATVTLDYNRFRTFPLPLTQCSRLQHLSLSHNELSELPPRIRRLSWLLELNLDYNRLGPDLPPEMMYLSRLQRLGLDMNRLGSVPHCVLMLPQLINVRLNGNRPSNYVVKDSVTGEVLDGINVPVRHDGYLQLREAVMTKDEGSELYKKRVQHLDGLVPATDLNLENAFHDRDKDEIGRKILHGRK
ncbi:hypothetical protein SDRG_08128 [Saprolegnia diclina VS20]|uniref:Uncharacterized protein n=1 Tax=Saprolegnia diclina (strain VS20) TaxID=1156394 RepID=T0RVB0_SAPDV|nr:hypothetical protein SDRG_08128 [Saprolegnia diclina VS20]EQC34357.1 hypothetical protein SDRG_08128 [Saprolegnia diclina VS20]|eukprot:XP_008612219.1 hypothetical protein SDRG_08128 [Saprolegnia diclina VS20]